jgi:hypothetical protein
MDIRLQTIKLRNFKGTPDLTVDLQGQNASIFGDNGSGKTTIYDAFTWLLFDKNSLNATQFDVKPIGLTRPEVEVSDVITVDGREIELKKTLVEKWTRRHNDPQETFTGNESKYFINQIEKKLKDYTAFIDGIISEKDFRMITSAEYFLGLKKPEMRSVLIRMAGGISDMDVAGDDPQLVNLVQTMQDKGWSVDDMLKLTKQNIALYNTENQSIGTRIDEVRRGMPDPQDYKVLETGLATAKGYLTEIDKRLSSARSAVLDVQRKQSELSALRIKIDKYIRQRTAEANADAFQKQLDLQKAQSKAQVMRAKLSTNIVEAYRTQIDGHKVKLLSLSEEYKRIAKERKDVAEQVAEPLAEDATVCDKCGQILPPDQIEKLAEQALISFHDRQTAKMVTLDAELAKITAQGKTLSEQKTNAEKRLADAELAYAQAVADAEEAERIAKELEAGADVELTEQLDLTGDPTYDQMLAEAEALEQSIVMPEDKTGDLLASKAKLESQVDDIQKRLKGREDREKATARIEELTERGQQLTGLISGEKAKQYQIERFIRLRSENLEEKINDMFEGISFRLFDVQINGGIVDDCTPLINNVAYASASNSERIRANQSIVKAMQRSQGITAPCFLDNAEAATWFIDMDCQVIKLVVSEPDKFLRIERED